MNASTVVRGERRQRVIGMDVGDRTSVLAVLERDGTLTEGEVRTTRAAVRARFAGEPPTLVVLEVGPHSPWLSRLLRELGHAPLVANPSRLPYLTRSGHKTDRVDAATLAHLARANVELLHPVEHRSEQGQAELAVIRARNAAVEARTALINHIRGAVKAFGERLPACSAPAFARRAGALIPEALRPALEPLLDLVATLTAQIRGYDGTLAEVAGRHPAVRVLTAIRGVGTLTALAYVLTLEDPHRFRHSRDVGAFLGLVPRRRQSGARDPELPITKTGDRALRRLLVQCAHYILGRHGEDSNLRRWGLRYAGEGSRSRKKKAVVAVARRLAVLLHHLWVTGEVYEPLYGTDTPATSAA